MGPAAMELQDHGLANVHAEIPDVPLDEERLMRQAAREEETCIGSRESINMLPTKEYLDLTVMTPLLEGVITAHAWLETDGTVLQGCT